MTCTIRQITPRGDGRIRPLPIPPSENALREATLRGYEDGERMGYVTGWRVGLGYGLLYGTLAGGIAVWAALQLGLLVGGA